MIDLHQGQTRIFNWQKVLVPMEFIYQITDRIKALEQDFKKEIYPYKKAQCVDLIKINQAILERMEGDPLMKILKEKKIATLH